MNQFRKSWDQSIPSDSIYASPENLFQDEDCQCETEPQRIAGVNDPLLTVHYDEKMERNNMRIVDMRGKDYIDFMRRNYFQQIQPPMIINPPK